MGESKSRTAIVTGASGAIGEAIARGLAGQEGLRVIMAASHQGRLAAAAKRVSDDTGSSEVESRVVDLSRKCEIEEFASVWDGPLDILVNNAAATPRSRKETAEGIEYQFATNVLGYYWMIDFFRSALSRCPGARIVNVASYWAGGLNFDDLEFRTRPYDNDSAYRQSKQADRMLSAGFAEKLKSSGITVNACHPGDVRSKLSSDLGFGGHQTPNQGAETPVWAALSKELDGRSGRYFEHLRESSCPFCRDKADVNRLMEVCASY